MAPPALPETRPLHMYEQHDNLILNFVSESTKKRKPELSDDAYSEKRSRKSEDKTSPTSASQGKRDKKSERKRVSANISDTRKP